MKVTNSIASIIVKFHVIAMTGFLFLIPICTMPVQADSTVKPTVVKMNGAKYLTYGPIFIADSRGYFKDHGIQIKYVPFTTASSALPALINNEIDVFAGVLSAGLLNALGISERIKVIADRGYLAAEGCTFMGLLLRKKIINEATVNGPADLAGLSISANISGALGYFLETYLSIGGVDLKDLRISRIPPPAAGEAIESGALAGSVLAEPWLTRMENTGLVTTFAKAQEIIPNYQLGILAFGEKLLQENPEAGVRFVAAYLQGIRDYLEGKTDDNVNIIVERTGLGKPIIDAACWPPFRENGKIDFTGIDAFQNWAIKSGYLDNAVTEKQFWDPSYIQKASALLN